jgi:uncharacterized protein (TIGR04255 family)
VNNQKSVYNYKYGTAVFEQGAAIIARSTLELLMKYKSPSIIEALCEFTFAPDTPWDSTIFGRFYEQVKNDFPQREEGELVSATLALNLQPAQAPAAAPQLKRSPRMAFSREGRTRLIQVSERLLTVNVLAPYPGWDEQFRTMILAAMDAYRSVTEISEASQVVLRYLDRFEFEAQAFRLGNWLNCDGGLFPRELAEQSLMAYQIRHPQSNGEHFAMTAVSGPAENNPTACNVILDTQIIRAVPITMEESSTPLLESMHGQIINAFERSITGKMRDRLEPLPQENGDRP